MARRRRNKVVLWDWSPDGKHKEPRPRRDRQRSAGLEALGAVVLLGVIIFVLSKVPDTRGGYGRGHLARYMCQLVGTDPESPQCIAVSMGGWLLVVVTIGLVLKAGRDVLKAIGAGGKDA